MKIVNFKKFIRSIFLILLVIFALSLICAKASLSHKEVEYKTLCVSEGDTLWSIAKDLQSNNDFFKNKDVREIIFCIKDINHLNNSSLYVNQELLIPTI